MNSMKLFFALCLGLPLCIACSSKPAAEEEPEKEVNTVTITHAQFKEAEMQVGDAETRDFEEYLTTSAVVTLSPDGHALISSPVSGTVSRIHHQVGDQLKKGSIILSLRSMEGIALQQEYAETFSRFRVVKENYERQKQLTQENVTSRKEFSLLEGEYKSLQGKTEGLRARLKMLGIDPSGTENGKILEEIPVTAAIDGYLSRMDAVSGQLIRPETEIIEQINPAKYQLVLKVFSQDLSKLETGQEVFLSVPAGSAPAAARLRILGKSMDPETKTIDCIAVFSEPNPGGMVLDMVHTVRVRLDSRKGPAVPEEALIKSGNDLYVLVKQEETADKITFIRQKVSTGLTQAGFTQILSPQQLKGILLRGVGDIPLE